MLEQVDVADQKPHVIAYFSKKMTPCETRYPIREQELLALVAALKHWEHYLRGRPFIVYTDHQSLIYIQTHKHLTGRLARWHNFMVDFEFEVRYRPGKNNPVADALSRTPVTELNLLFLDTFSQLISNKLKTLTLWMRRHLSLFSLRLVTLCLKSWLKLLNIIG